MLCCQKVVEGKDEVVFCGAGECRGWFHRYCAGVSLAQYESLQAQPQASGALVPFLCPMCMQQAHKEEVKELQDIIVTLREELAQLQDAVKSRQPANVQKKSYADAAVSRKQGTAPTPRLRENVSGDFGDDNSEGGC